MVSNKINDTKKNVEKPVKKKFTDIELNEMRAKDAVLVKGVFRNFESPGNPMSFPYKKYKDEPLVRYTVEDGVEMTLPRGVAKHLRQTGTIHTFKLEQDPFTRLTIKKPVQVRRYTFEATGFIDEVNDKVLYTL